MAEIPLHSIHSPFYAGPAFSHTYHVAEPSSNLSDISIPCDPHFPPQPPYSPHWRPANYAEFNTWDVSTQGMFPSTPVGPGQNSGQPSHPQRGPPSNSGAVPTSNPRKRKRTTPSNRSSSSVGGFGPLPPGETATEPSSPTPFPPPLTSGGRLNGAADVWAFARPLASTITPPMDEWPTSSEPILVTKPKTPRFGCKLCSEFGCVISLSACRRPVLIPFFIMIAVTVWDRSSGQRFPTTRGLHQRASSIVTSRSTTNQYGSRNARDLVSRPPDTR